MKIRRRPFVVCCLTMILAACGTTENTKKGNVQPVQIKQVEKVCKKNEREFAFISNPYRVSDLSFRVGGIVDFFDVYTGSFIKKGEVIAEIDDRDFQIRKEHAEAVYKCAEAEFRRVSLLFEKNNVAASVYEKARAEYVVAKTAYETAVNELEDTKLRAPFDGYVGEVYIDCYQDVKASQPVISFIDVSRLKLEVYVTQEIAADMNGGMMAQFYFDAKPGKIYREEVDGISKSVTNNNLSYLMTVVFPNQEEKLPAGMSGKLSVLLPEDSEVLLVPQSAVVFRPALGEFVWVVDNMKKTVSRRMVKTDGFSEDGLVRVVEGLDEGEYVAVSGLRFLSEGMNVELVVNR